MKLLQWFLEKVYWPFIVSILGQCQCILVGWFGGVLEHLDVTFFKSK
jgi:hypothetical protein